MTDDNVRQIWSDAELDAALADLHGDPGPDDGLAFARASLLAAAGVPPEEEGPAPRKSRGSWRWIAVAAAVTALTGGLVVATQIGSQDPTPVAPAATDPGLDQLRGVDLPIRPGEYRHTTRSSWTVLTQGPYHKPMGYLGDQLDLWIPADPAGTWYERGNATNSPAGLPVPSPHFEPVPLHKTDDSGPGGMFSAIRAEYSGKTFRGSWDNPTAPFIAALPADVEVLRDRLIHDPSTMGSGSAPSNPNSPATSIYMVQRVLSLGLVRGEVRVALWHALARVPGIVTTPGMAAPDGRTGIGFTATTLGETLIADPATAQLVAFTVPPKNEREPNSVTPSSPQRLTTTIDMPNTTTSPPPFEQGGPYSRVEIYTYAISKTNA